MLLMSTLVPDGKSPLVEIRIRDSGGAGVIFGVAPRVYGGLACFGRVRTSLREFLIGLMVTGQQNSSTLHQHLLSSHIQHPLGTKSCLLPYIRYLPVTRFPTQSSIVSTFAPQRSRRLLSSPLCILSSLVGLGASKGSLTATRPISHSCCLEIILARVARDWRWQTQTECPLTQEVRLPAVSVQQHNKPHRYQLPRCSTPYIQLTLPVNLIDWTPVPVW